MLAQPLWGRVKLIKYQQIWGAEVHFKHACEFPSAQPPHSHLCSHGRRGKSQFVALTRSSREKNAELSSILRKHGIFTIDLPCLIHDRGPDRAQLLPTLLEGGWEFIVVTSPHSAQIILSTWKEACCPPINVVALGRGTSAVFDGSGIDVFWQPTVATTKQLISQFPQQKGRAGSRVLYPTTTRASTLVQQGLQTKVRHIDQRTTADILCSGLQSHETQYLQN